MCVGCYEEKGCWNECCLRFWVSVAQPSWHGSGWQLKASLVLAYDTTLTYMHILTLFIVGKGTFHRRGTNRFSLKVRPTKFRRKQTHTIQARLVPSLLQGLPVTAAGRELARSPEQRPGSALSPVCTPHGIQWLSGVLPHEVPGTPVWSGGCLEQWKRTDQRPPEVRLLPTEWASARAGPPSDPRASPVLGRRCGCCHSGTEARSQGTSVHRVLIPTRGPREFSPGD